MLERTKPETEDVRQFWNSRPCNIRHSPQPVGTREYFDQVEERKYLVEPHIPGFAQFGRWKGKKVLEIGCGLGTDTTNFARAGASVTAVDLSDVSVALCRKRLEMYGLKANIMQADAENLSLTVPVEPFDLIYSFGVIHHTPHPENVIRQIRKYCHPGTEVRIMVYSGLSWKLLETIVSHGKGRFWQWRTLIREYSEAQTGSPVTFTYSKRSARELLAGFDVISVRKDHIFPYQVEPYKRYEYKKRLIFRLMPALMYKFLERTLGWHTLIVARPLVHLAAQ